jgi:hypothetical protein
MTYTTRLTGRKAMSISHIMTMVLAGFVLVLVQSSTVHAQWITNGNNINNTNTGNVGIGTTSPGSLLHLNSGATPANTQVRITANGLGSLSLLTYAADNIQLGFDQDWSGSAMIARNASATRIFKNAGKLTFSGNTGLTVGSSFTPTDRLSIDLATGNVGIGTTSLLGKMQIVTSNDTNASVPAWDGRHFVVGADGNSGGLALSYNQTNGYGVISALSPNVAWRNIAIAPNGGNVGIGTTSPATKLHVVGDGTVTGNLTVSGNIAAKYQDVAEWVQSSQALAAGTVVVLDQTKSNQVIASFTAYDTRVAGVISSQPGITLGENGAGKVLVATTGRVRIKVDASRGSIKIGDLLVTSDVAGVAMKSQPIDVAGVQIHRPGTLIGKALEPLAKGTGEILVLLSLQ